MGLKIEYIDGQTPLDESEQEGLLIKSITTREELDELIIICRGIIHELSLTDVTKYRLIVLP